MSHVALRLMGSMPLVGSSRMTTWGFGFGLGFGVGGLGFGVWVVGVSERRSRSDSASRASTNSMALHLLTITPCYRKHRTNAPIPRSSPLGGGGTQSRHSACAADPPTAPQQAHPAWTPTRPDCGGLVRFIYKLNTTQLLLIAGVQSSPPPPPPTSSAAAAAPSPAQPPSPPFRAQ